MKTKCISIKVDEVKPITEKAIVVIRDGVEEMFPKMAYFGADEEEAGNVWLAEWILKKKENFIYFETRYKWFER